MIRSDFLRSAVLAPLVALIGCKREAPPIHLETEPVLAPFDAERAWSAAETSPIQATAWTITTAGSTGPVEATMWVSEPGGRWHRLRP